MTDIPGISILASVLETLTMLPPPRDLVVSLLTVI
jgi:hypothetical protein